MHTILLIEHDAALRHMLNEILGLAGYHVHTAASGMEGVQMINDAMPDLIICELALPDLPGLQILDLLRKSRHIDHVPFIVLTANDSRKEIRKVMGKGADDYLVKPFDHVDLLDTLATRLSKSTHHQTYQVANPTTLFDDATGRAVLKRLARNQELREFGSREMIFGKGEQARYMFLVRTGRVMAYRVNASGKHFVTDIYGPGDFFGVEALIFDWDSRESAMALEKSSLYLIPREPFLEVLQSDRHFSALILTQLASNIKSREENMLSIAYDSVRKRIAKALIKLGDKAENGGSFRIFREDLSNMVGTAKESVSRTLTEFRKEHLIDIDRGRITILSRDKLAKLPG